MFIRRLAILSLAAFAGLAPRTAAAELLAGFHQFDTVTQTGVGFTKTGADEGIFAATATISYDTGSTHTGGSTDNWYGPDGTNVYNGTSTGILGGHITNQTPFAPTSPGTVNPPYVFETTSPVDPRLSPGYAVGAPVPATTVGLNDSTGDGRINSFNGTDISIRNDTGQAYHLDSFVFDAFVGDVTAADAFVNIDDFVLVYEAADGTTFSQAVGVSAGYAGYHNQSGEGLNSPLINPLIVNNQVDYGVGMNYLDYVVNLDGLIMNPGDSISIGLNSTAIFGTARGDNFAFFGTAVPEPSSVLAIAALLGLGAWKRRRKSQAVSKHLPLHCACALVAFTVSGIGIGAVCAEAPSVNPVSLSAAKDPAPWPRFHGHQGNGGVADGHLPATWTADDYAWSLDLGGSDVGSPVATSTTVFLVDAKTEKGASAATTSAGTIDFVAVDLASGKELWRHAHPFVDSKRHARNSPASTTPAVAGNRVFFAFGDATGAYLYAYTLDGKLIWDRQLGPWSGVHGFGASPMVTGDQLILFNSQQVDELESWQVAGQSQMMSFDVATGEDRWTTPLTATRPCYGVPTVYQPVSNRTENQSPGEPQLIAANKGNGLFGLDLRTGEMLWSLSVFDKRCCSSPLVVGDLAIASCGSGGGGNYMAAVRIPQHAGESPREVFRIARGACYVPTPAVKDGLLFTVSDNGIASSFDTADDGRPRWSQRLGGNFGASPIIVGEQLLMISLDGVAHVTAASGTKSEISEFELGDRVGATPAFSTGRLLLRVGAKLHCLDCRETE